MATELAININNDDSSDEYGDLLSVFKTPQTDTTIIRTVLVRGEIPEAINRNTKEITVKFPPSVSNQFNKVNTIKYNINLQLEEYDTEKQSWAGSVESNKIAPISGIGARWFESCNVRLAQTNITSAMQNNILEHFVVSKLTVNADQALTIGTLEAIDRDVISPVNLF